MLSLEHLVRCLHILQGRISITASVLEGCCGEFCFLIFVLQLSQHKFRLAYSFELNFLDMNFKLRLKHLMWLYFCYNFYMLYCLVRYGTTALKCTFVIGKVTFTCSAVYIRVFRLGGIVESHIIGYLAPSSDQTRCVRVGCH
jgi:hypothetical protein